MVIVSVVFIFIVKFGIRCRLKRKIGQKCGILFNKRDVHLLTLFLFRVSSMCLCKGAVLVDDDIIFYNNLSSTSKPTVTNGDDSKYDFSQSSQTNLWTIAAAASVTSGETSDSLYIVRNNLGDTFFDVDQSWFSCSLDKCLRRSGGTATVALDLNNIADGQKLFFDRHGSPTDKLCYCRCLQSTPIFREDLHVCVNDIHECAVVSFVSGNIEQKIPYVFLPLRGQIVHPNAEIKFNGIHSVPTCIISRVRYLSRSGWYDIKNYTIGEYNHESSTPFRLFHDKRRTFLQWLGNADLRSSMEGRLVLIDLICKDMDSQLIFTPCISFRIAGVPSSSNFFPDDGQDRTSNLEKEKKFSSNEYVALGLATLVIALIYVASVFLYLNFKKNKLKEKSLRRNKAFKQFIDMEDNASHLFSDSSGQSKQLIVEEEGLVKNNPLLMKRYHSPTTSNMPSLTSGENSTFNGLHGHNVNSVDKIEIYSPVSDKRPSLQDHFRVNNNIGHSSGSFESLEQRWTLFRNRLTTPFDVRNELKGKLMISHKQIQNETNNIEEKHPDENISIVECPEDVIQTNSKHKLYFNPAYLEPELLMAPPPAAVEFLIKIREIMTIARRKILTKRFLPSLTKIPEESQSVEEQTAKSGTSLRRQNSKKVDEAYAASEKVAPAKTAHQCEEKEKRQIIQKWLQSIPTSQTTEKVCPIAEVDDLRQRTSEELHRSSTFRRRNDNEKKFAVDSGTMQYETAIRTAEDFAEVVAKRDLETVKTKIVSHSLERKGSRKKSKEGEKPCENDEKTESIMNISNISNGGFNSSLPLDEELTMQNTIYNIVTGSTTLSKMKIRYENDPEYCSRNVQDEYSLSDEHVENKYSLVSEVYVNDGFSSSSSNSSLSSSSNSLPERMAKVDKEIPRNEFHESSRLMIQLAECPFFYSMENTDDFEPDTLDRKPDKDEKEYQFVVRNKFVDSLERPAICLRTRGSFRNDSTLSSRTSSLKRSFGSLQEIYQQRRNTDWSNHRHMLQPVCEHRDGGPSSLTPQVENFLWRKDRYSLRHTQRQRKSSPPPPIPHDADDVCCPSKSSKPPLPPRKRNSHANKSPKPDLEWCFRVHNFRRNSSNNKDPKTCIKNNIWSYRLDDSGYLSSSDSDKSQPFEQQNRKPFAEIRNERDVSCIDTLQTITSFHNDDDDDDDDSTSSCNDGNSESGAESTATNFKFYKNRGRIANES